jgi:membrane-associated phospholipid phosphatase
VRLGVSEKGSDFQNFGSTRIGEIRLRVRANLALKIALSIVLSPGIFGIYLFLQRHLVFPVTTLSPTWLDRMIPFAPGGVYLYQSIWLLTPIAPWLMSSKAELVQYTRGLISISLLAFVVFLVYPTACIRPETKPATNYLYSLVIQVDRELNAFPSLHAAFAVFHALCCFAVFSQIHWATPLRWVIWIWTLGIILSTLLTKQHVVLDVVSGSLLGIVGYTLCCCSHKRR